MRNLGRLSALLLITAGAAACAAESTAPVKPKIRTPEEVFDAECALCHGMDGAGGSAPSLFDRVPKLMDDALSSVITDGKGGMPARPGVTKAELTPLVAHLRERFGAYVDPTPTMMPRDGAAIFAAECAGCHGADGTGGRFAPSLATAIPAREDAAIRTIITMGTGMMPARNVVEPELTTLMTYLRATFGAYVPPMPGTEGRTVYEAQCARCHGEDGITGRAPNLSQRIPHLSNPYLTLTITQGSGNMRGRMVTEAELAALIPYLRSAHGAYAHGAPDVAIDATGGRDVYVAECARCHGDDGTGASASSLVTALPTLSNAQLVAATTSDPGHAGLTPVSEARLTPLVAYLREAFGAYAPPRPPMGMDGGVATPDTGVEAVDAGPVPQDSGVASDAGVAIDASAADAGAFDTGVAMDGGVAMDASVAIDAGAADAATGVDATAPDAAVDAGGIDGGAADAGVPAAAPLAHLTCGDGVVDGLETCDGTTWASWAPGPDCADFGLGTGAATCGASCYPSLASCATTDLCTAQGWYGDGWCDACDRLGGTVDTECTTACGADGFCADYWDSLSGVWTCQALGLVDPDCGTCGDGVATNEELCDGADLGGFDCTGYGYRAGTLACTASCLPDLSGCTNALCTDTCTWANDGECDDGGPGSQYNVCDLGSDCGDCGPR